MKLLGEAPLTASERARRYRERHPDRVQASQAKYNGTEKAKAKSRRYYESHTDENVIKVAKWRSANPQRARELGRESYARHREKYAAKARRWQAENLDRLRHYQHVRRAAKRENGVFAVTKRELRRLITSPCVACGSVDRIHIDHIIPIARGGRHSIGNLQPLCQPCNQSKGAKFMAEWRRL